MSLFPLELTHSAANGAAAPHGFGHRLAQTLDAFVASRTKRMVPEAVLRRSRQDMNRCRRLMLKPRMTTADARISRHSERRLTPTIQPR